MTDQDSEFHAKLRALVNQPTGGADKPTVAPDPVNQPMIRHWAAAFADDEELDDGALAYTSYWVAG